jgi:hypothetical protein
MILGFVELLDVLMILGFVELLDVLIFIKVFLNEQL